MKHKGYNNTYSGGNATAQKFKYNGIELEEVTGLYEMDLRAYDPAIGRWNGIDIVDHFEYSPYQAFDNNPIFFADPSGADSESDYDWEAHDAGNTGVYKSGSFDAALANVDDNKRTNSKTGEVTIYTNNDDVDREYVDGKLIRVAEKGSLEAELIANGTKYKKRKGPTAVGMKLTDLVLSAIAVEAILIRSGFYALFGRVAQGVSVSAKNMVFTAAEKAAIKTATGYSRSRIVNGVGIIDKFGFYNKTTHTQLKLIINAFKKNGATSINIYTNSANTAMKTILNSRIKSGKKLFGILSVEKRKVTGYVLKAKF